MCSVSKSSHCGIFRALPYSVSQYGSTLNLRETLLNNTDQKEISEWIIVLKRSIPCSYSEPGHISFHVLFLLVSVTYLTKEKANLFSASAFPRNCVPLNSSWNQFSLWAFPTKPVANFPFESRSGASIVKKKLDFFKKQITECTWEWPLLDWKKRIKLLTCIWFNPFKIWTNPCSLDVPKSTTLIMLLLYKENEARQNCTGNQLTHSGDSNEQTRVKPRQVTTSNRNSSISTSK